MKIFFTLLFASILYLGANAQIWDASEMASATYTDDSYSFNGLTIYADDDKTVVIDKNSKSVDDKSFTQRIKLGGSPRWTDDTTPSARLLSFNVTGDVTITIYAMSSSSSASDRYIAAYAGDKNTMIFNGNVDCCSLMAFSGTYSGEATTVFIGSEGSGINVYGIEVSGSTQIKYLESNIKVVSVEYYSITGQLTGNNATSLPKGIYIKRVIYDNGESITSKVNILF